MNNEHPELGNNSDETTPLPPQPGPEDTQKIDEPDPAFGAGEEPSLPGDEAPTRPHFVSPDGRTTEGGPAGNQYATGPQPGQTAPAQWTPAKPSFGKRVSARLRKPVSLGGALGLGALLLLGSAGGSFAVSELNDHESDHNSYEASVVMDREAFIFPQTRGHHLSKQEDAAMRQLMEELRMLEHSGKGIGLHQTNPRTGAILGPEQDVQHN